VETKIPLEKLTANDLFDDEIHLTMATEIGKLTNIRFSLSKETKSAVNEFGTTYSLNKA
jgi:sporulation protein YlmC with PRC-barrel domain